MDRLENNSGRLELHSPERHQEKGISKPTISDTFSGATRPELQFPFCRDGFSHELLEQADLVCLVRRSKGNRQIHFEVVVLQWSKGRTWPSGRISPDGWHYPSSEQWGTYGWTYRDLVEARPKYHSLSLKWLEKHQA
jgi:hypothetical protein